MTLPLARLFTSEEQLPLNPQPIAPSAAGFWPSRTWRVFYAVDTARGKVYGKRGPVAMSDYGAQVETADFLEAGLRHGISTRVVRYDYDRAAGRWRRA
jgi:hypothetical protein